MDFYFRLWYHFFAGAVEENGNSTNAREIKDESEKVAWGAGIAKKIRGVEEKNGSRIWEFSSDITIDIWKRKRW